MPRFENRPMFMVSGGEPWTHTCDIRYDDQTMAVSYEDIDDNNNPIVVVYEGIKIAGGMYRLESRRMNGHATIYFVNRTTLEGNWVEQGEEGTWKITLTD